MRHRPLLVGLAFLLPCVVIALGVYSIVRNTARRDAPPVASASAQAAQSSAPEPASSASSASSASADAEADESPPAAAHATPAGDFLDETDDGEPAPAKKAPPKHYATIQQAAAESCSTASVEGLSKQIIAQARCLKPNAFVPLPTRANLTLAANVFPYLELAARDHLLKALDANPSKKMTINSALRTVAQQYLVSRWAVSKRCGVQLATQPGESNHELGSALDIAEPALWRPALEAQQFRWLGTSDRVHFDYKSGEKSAEASSASATDVLAFQMLWNRNHADDPLTADGRYSPATEQRLKKAPPGGFATGPSCKASAKRSK